MKHFSRKARLRQKRKLRKILRKQEKKLRKIRRRNNFRKWWTDNVVAPEILGVFKKSERKKTVGFIKKFRDLSRKEGRKIRLDFSKTNRMYADATLLFRSTLCQVLKLKPDNAVIKCAPSKTARINEVLHQIDALSALGQNFHITPSDENVVHWRYAQGAGAEGEKYEEILGHYDGVMADKLLTGLFCGLTEAMTNTRQHAYPNRNIDEAGLNEWWMFSQEKDGRLFVSFCDLGIGIPESLPRNIKQGTLWKSLVAKFGPSPKDSDVINGAILNRRSSTGHGYRGRGLKQLTDVISATDNGELALHSNKGCYYLYENRGSQLTDYSESLGGTLISWSLPIE